MGMLHPDYLDTGRIPVALCAPEPCGAVQDARCIFAIHNLSHQGVDPAATFPNFGLPDTWSALSCGACGTLPILSPHTLPNLLGKACPAGHVHFMT